MGGNQRENSMQGVNRKKDALVISISLLANILLAGLKTSIGVLGHSPALLADGINSTSDVAYSIVVSIFVRLAHKPADDEHPYGHSQLESIGAVVIGSFVITTAIAIFWNSINTIFDLIKGIGIYQGASSAALWIALFTILTKIILTIYSQRIGNQTKNASILALAYDHRNDIYSAMAVMVGIIFGQRGFYWVDPFAGAIVSLVILRTGIEILRESTADLMDTVPGQTLRAEIEDLMTSNEKIDAIGEVHAHRYGPYLMINITVCINGNLKVVEGDKIATWVEQTIMESISSVRHVHVHYHQTVIDWNYSWS